MIMMNDLENGCFGVPPEGQLREGPHADGVNDVDCVMVTNRSSSSTCTASTNSTLLVGHCRRASPWLMSVLIIGIGCLAGTIILAFGIGRHNGYIKLFVAPLDPRQDLGIWTTSTSSMKT